MTTDYRSIMRWLLDGRSYTEISTSLGCSRKTISHTKHVLTTQDLTLDQIQNLTSSQIKELFPDNRRRDPAQFLQPDMAAIAKRRMTRTRVTRKVEWERLTRAFFGNRCSYDAVPLLWACGTACFTPARWSPLAWCICNCR